MRRVLLGGFAALVVAGGVRRARTLSAVAPELRAAPLWLPLSMGSTLELTVARRLFARQTEPVDGVTVSRHRIPGGQEAFIHDPGGQAPLGALLWMHGGGMVLGAPDGDHELCSRIARDVGVVVVSVRYRLAPEHPFPAGLDDCWAALRWLHDRAPSLGVDAYRVAVGGASAGGGLAAGLVQRAYDGDVPVAFQLLVYPMLDDRTAAREDHAGRGRIGWTPRSNTFAWRQYLGHRPATQQPPAYAAPARRDDLTGLPPAWIGVGTLDLFYPEDQEYARRLRAAGVPVELRTEAGMYHAAEVGPRASSRSMRAFQESAFGALHRAVGAPATTEPSPDRTGRSTTQVV